MNHKYSHTEVINVVRYNADGDVMYDANVGVRDVSTENVELSRRVWDKPIVFINKKN